MSAENWLRCCDVTLDYEGGNDDDPHDPGGRTSRGILQREWNIYRGSHPGMPQDVFKAPQAAIVDIYRTKYWQVVDGDDWPVGCDLCVYDAGVNSGTGKAFAWARATMGQEVGTIRLMAQLVAHHGDNLGFIKRYQGKRLSFLHALRTWQYFGRGWGSRVAGIEAIATKWALAAVGQPVAPVLHAEAQVSNGKAKAAGASAAATPAAPAAHIATTIHHGWWDVALTCGVILLGLVAVAFLVHLWRVHSTRAAAFKLEASK